MSDSYKFEVGDMVKIKENCLGYITDGFKHLVKDKVLEVIGVFPDVMNLNIENNTLMNLNIENNTHLTWTMNYFELDVNHRLKEDEEFKEVMRENKRMLEL